MKKVVSLTRRAIEQYNMIEDGDKIAVGVSGGKDSLVLLNVLAELSRYYPKKFTVMGLTLDMGYDADYSKVQKMCDDLGVEYKVKKTNIKEIIFDIRKESNPCSLCAKMRRGHLYSKAKSLGCNKIALGHHFSDVVETTVMSMFYGAQLQAMPPKLHSQNFEGMELIRPMYCIHEDDILSWKRYNDLEFIQCACRFTENCATCDNDVSVSKRQETKLLLRRLKRDNPNIEKSIFNSIHSVCLDTMVGYKSRGVTHTFTEIYNTRTEELKKESKEDE